MGETLALILPSIISGIGGFVRGGGGQQLQPIRGGRVSNAFSAVEQEIGGQLQSAKDLQASPITIPGSDVSGAAGGANIPGLPSGLVGLFPGFQTANATARSFPGMPAASTPLGSPGGFGGGPGSGDGGNRDTFEDRQDAREQPGERGDRSDFPEDPTDPNQPPGHQVPGDTRPGAELFGASQQTTGDDQLAALQQTAKVVQALIDLQAQGKARA
jgi:hypothetical protein